MTKPADFMLGLLDFFAVLLPGAVATALVRSYLSVDIQKYLAIEGSTVELLPWIIFLLTSYTLGHFVFLLGSYLDPLYNRWRKRTKPTAHDVGYNAAKDLRADLTPMLVGDSFSTFKWARAFVEIHAPGSKLEIDRLEASSKFFRGLVVVSLPWMIHLMVAKPNARLALGDAFACALSFWRYCDQRWKMTELTYATAVLVYETKVKSQATKTTPKGDSEGGDGDDD